MTTVDIPGSVDTYLRNIYQGSDHPDDRDAYAALVVGEIRNCGQGYRNTITVTRPICQQIATDVAAMLEAGSAVHTAAELQAARAVRARIASVIAGAPQELCRFAAAHLMNGVPAVTTLTLEGLGTITACQRCAEFYNRAQTPNPYEVVATVEISQTETFTATLTRAQVDELAAAARDGETWRDVLEDDRSPIPLSDLCHNATFDGCEDRSITGVTQK